jgi:hypothetical protein
LVEQYITNADSEEPKNLCDVYNITPEQWQDFYEKKNTEDVKVLNNFLPHIYLISFFNLLILVLH